MRRVCGRLAQLLALSWCVAGCSLPTYDYPTRGDLAIPDEDARGAPDLAWSGSDLPPAEGGVGPRGGSVSRLLFGVTGDTRPADCDKTASYPSTIIRSIFRRMAASGVQFAVDLGDHMFVCNGSQQLADAQMGLYLDAAAQLGGRPTFMTLGNHECASQRLCSTSGYQNANFRAFMKALAPISDQPYYRFDVHTDGGLARFVIIADNAWSAAQQSWLEDTLSDADRRARFVFIARHHPLDNVDLPDYSAITAAIRAHKRTLVLTGHSHLFKLDIGNDPTGRTLVVGVGGAPLADPTGWYGYALVEQLANDRIAIRVYDQASGNQLRAFEVAP